MCVCVRAYDGLHSPFVHFFVRSARANPASFITAGLLVAVAFPLLFDKQLPGGKLAGAEWIFLPECRAQRAVWLESLIAFTTGAIEVFVTGSISVTLVGDFN